MSRRRTPKARKQPSLVQRLREWWAGLQPSGIQREVVGYALLLLALVTLLGLSGISTGAVLSAWTGAIRRVFGWGAYPMTFGMAFGGLQLVWRHLSGRLSLGPAEWLGLELLLLAALVASHMPLVARSGADEAFAQAEQGRGGGYVGWALAVPLLEKLGAGVGSAILLGALIVGLSLVLSLSWSDVQAWTRRRSRAAAALLGRWRAARRGMPVVPELPQAPWWEQEPEAEAARPRQAKPRRPRTAKAMPRDGALPPLDLLDPASPTVYGDADAKRKSHIIEETLESFGVPVRVVEVHQGPAVTQFGLDPGYVERRSAEGSVQRQRVRVARIAALSNDLALALSASPLRIEAPVPGRPVVGLEVPNDKVALVSLRSVMESPEFRRMNTKLAIALGCDVAGKPVSVDLGMMPHLLIAGATGSGKSVCINATICCLLFNNGPDELKMLMVDPKMVELIGYNGIPHLVAPVVVDPEQVVGALAWVIRQMDARYKLLHEMGARNLEQYNYQVRKLKDREALPTLVVLIDELADLMMMAPDEVERSIIRIAQKGRATGIHLVVATQRPSVDVVTGLIKANFPARISFAVTSLVDSRVILDQGGAENLLGRGDMLFAAPHLAAPIRVQGCFVSDPEIERLAEFWRTRWAADEPAKLLPPWAYLEEEEGADDLLDQAVQLVTGRERVSTSFIQRQLRIGFPRAARLMDQLEEQGVVGPDEGAGRGRQVLVA